MHLCGIFDLVWMVRHGRLLHRARGLTRFLGGRGNDAPGSSRRGRSDLFIDTLRHMVTAEPLSFETLTARKVARSVSQGLKPGLFLRRLCPD
jgi:hypothetical protein